MAGDGVEDLVLHLSKEDLGLPLAGLVVAAEGEEVAHLLVETLLRGADLPDAGEQLVEVVPAARVLQPLIVHEEAFHQKLPQMGGRPLAELGATRGADPVTDGEDEVEIVEQCAALHLTAALSLNCQGFLDSCRRSQFALVKDVLRVEGDVLLGGLEQLGDLQLREPHRLPIRPEIQAGAAIGGGIEDEVGHA